MSGWDNDFVVRGGWQWIVRRFVRRLKVWWPGLVCGVDLDVFSEAGVLLERYPDYFQISRDREMQERSYRNGLVADERGESPIDVLLRPLAGGWCGIDVVTAEPRPYWFSERVVECFSRALLDWYRCGSLRDYGRRWSGSRTYVVGLPIEPAWLERAVGVCVDGRMRQAGIVKESGIDCAVGGVEICWTLRVVREKEQKNQMAVFFCGVGNGRRGEVFAGVSFPGGAEGEWEKEVLAVLAEAVAMWHVISFRGTGTPPAAFTWPPGEPVLKGRLVEFEGDGGAYPPA